MAIIWKIPKEFYGRGRGGSGCGSKSKFRSDKFVWVWLNSRLPYSFLIQLVYIQCAFIENSTENNVLKPYLRWHCFSYQLQKKMQPPQHFPLELICLHLKVISCP